MKVNTIIKPLLVAVVSGIAFGILSNMSNPRDDLFIGLSDVCFGAFVVSGTVGFFRNAAKHGSFDWLVRFYRKTFMRIRDDEQLAKNLPSSKDIVYIPYLVNCGIFAALSVLFAFL